MKTVFSAALLTLFFSIAALGQEPKQGPTTELPGNVVIKDGTFGLFTDWKPGENGSLKVFAVNRSKTAVKLDYGYGNPKLFLEAKNKDGQWERATVHSDEMCGTGLGVYQLKPGNFSTGHFVLNQNSDAERTGLETEIKKIRDFMARARMTKEGYNAKLAEIGKLESKIDEISKAWGKREIRIRTYSQSKNSNGFSNTTDAPVDLRLIAKSKHDSMAIRYASLDRLEAIITGSEVLKPLEGGLLPSNPVHTALHAVGSEGHSIEHATAILERVVAESKDQTLVAIAKSKLASKPFKQ